MGFIVFLLIAGWGVYQFFKFNTTSGAETTRAYVYLEALLNGETKEAAQGLASGDMMNLDTEVLHHIVNEIRTVHRGKQLPLIAEAYRRGMTSDMPGWYQWSASQCDPSPSVFTVYTAPLSMKDREETQPKTRMPEWVRSFTLYFVLEQLTTADQGPLPGAPLIPDDLIVLLTGTLTHRLQLSLPASLRLYMDYAYPEIRDYGAHLIPGDTKHYLAKAMKHIREPGVLMEIMQNVHTESGLPSMSDAELYEMVAQLRQSEGAGTDTAQMMYGMGLLSITKDEFRARHGKSYEEFEAEMVAFTGRRMADSGPITPTYRPNNMEQNTVNPQLNGQIATFEEYYRILVSEAKRLSGKQETDVHIIEMMEDAPYKRAFFDGTDPRDLAMQLHIQNGGQRH